MDCSACLSAPARTKKAVRPESLLKIPHEKAHSEKNALGYDLSQYDDRQHTVEQ